MTVNSALTAPIKVGPAVDPEHAVQLQQITGGGVALNYLRLFKAVADIAAPSELGLYNGKDAGHIIVRQTGPPDLYCDYEFDPSGNAAADGRYIVVGKADADYSNPVWIAHGPYSIYGDVKIDGKLLPAGTNTFDFGSSSFYWNVAYIKTVTLGQDPTAALQAATKQYVDNKVQLVSVADLNNPAAELASKTGTAGSQLIAYQTAGATNDVSTTYFADTSAGAVNVPYVVQGSGVRWIANGGARSNGEFISAASIRGASGSVTNNWTVGGQMQSATINATGAATIGTFLNLTTQPCVIASFVGSQSITNATNTTITWTEATDRGSNFASGTFTVPTGGAGPYFLGGLCQGDCSVANQSCAMIFIKNGVTTIASFGQNTGPAHFYTGNQAQLVVLADGDTVVAKFRQDTGTTATLTTAELFYMKLG